MTAQWAIFEGDALALLRTVPDCSIDSIVTDPPYFLTNVSGSGFMGKEWDSLSLANVIAVAFFKSMRLVCGMGEEGAVVGSASTPRTEKRQHDSFARLAGESSSAEASLSLSTCSAHELVITKAEALASSGSSPMDAPFAPGVNVTEMPKPTLPLPTDVEQLELRLEPPRPPRKSSKATETQAAKKAEALTSESRPRARRRTTLAR